MATQSFPKDFIRSAQNLSGVFRRWQARHISDSLDVHNERAHVDVMDFVIRPLTSDDEPILWEMLYHALNTGESDTAPPRDIVRRPEFARFVEGWGREGDAGFVAHDSKDHHVLGAVWFRLPLGDATPELAFTVTPGYRRHGIGAALLTQWVRANPEQSEISLRVGASSPAARLYERFGFRVVNQTADAVVMCREG